MSYAINMPVIATCGIHSRSSVAVLAIQNTKFCLKHKIYVNHIVQLIFQPIVEIAAPLTYYLIKKATENSLNHRWQPKIHVVTLYSNPILQKKKCRGIFYASLLALSLTILC